MSLEFENAWYELNLRLRGLESTAGLVAALQALETHHLNSGFIAGTPDQIERFTYRDRANPARYFRVQFNPKRARRFNGAVRPTPHPPNQSNGCFLCRDNIEWQQHGAQLGYRVDTGGRSYFALTNPFPILPGHIVVAATDHRTQDWHFHDGDGIAFADLIDDLVSLTDRLPGYLGFYNGVDGGSSIPGHLHYQFVLRPDNDGIFPLEAAAQSASNAPDGTAFIEHYPLPAVLWKGGAAEVKARATHWIASWSERNRVRLYGLTANFMTTRDDTSGEVSLYFVPRDRTKLRANGFTGLAGGIEALGEIVVSTPEERTRLLDGSIDYSQLESALATLHTPLEIG